MGFFLSRNFWIDSAKILVIYFLRFYGIAYHWENSLLFQLVSPHIGNCGGCLRGRTVTRKRALTLKARAGVIG